jgi:formylglycine-generating enzyme required for sulfatase activity
MPHVFISYVRENLETANRLCDALKSHGVPVWLDRNEIMPGMFWKDAIRRAIQDGDFFICCFSSEYNQRPRSYVNEELNLAIEQLRQRPNNQVWFIPVILSPCEVPDWDIGAGRTLRDIQWADLGADWNEGVRRILTVIQPEGPAVDDDMVLIPAGQFQMGTDPSEIPALVEWAKQFYPDFKPEWLERETPRHTVFLDDFYIDRYAVTNEKYEAFMNATGHDPPRYWDDERFNAPKQPVVSVTWYDAMTYCQWAGKRLPTEAEWEKAARGGLVGQRFPWGDDDPDGSQCNFADKHTDFEWSVKTVDDGYQYTAPVGQYPPNGYGLYDMAGNVWEWCLDEYQENFYKAPEAGGDNPYAGGALEETVRNFTNLGVGRVLRGGSWYDGPNFLRVARRSGLVPDLWDLLIGFRLVSPRFRVDS